MRWLTGSGSLRQVYQKQVRLTIASARIDTPTVLPIPSSWLSSAVTAREKKTAGFRGEGMSITIFPGQGRRGGLGGNMENP